MYEIQHGTSVSADTYRTFSQSQVRTICTCVFAAVFAVVSAATALAQELQSSSVIRKISGLTDKLELTTNSSRILTLDKNIPRVQVNNPELLAVTPLSATQVQISAKKAGVTQVNLWDDEGKIHAIDVLIYGDARELEVALQTQFPHASIKVFRYSESLVLSGFVDRPDHVSPIMQLAQDYSPKVINNITVGGVQQILLKVKVMEVSRSKLRDLGVDWAIVNGDSVLAASNVSGLLQNSGSIIASGGALTKVGGPVGSGGQTFQFGVFKGNSAFLGFLDALQRCQAAKILSEPNIVAVSGRPAQFQVGGEIPIPIPQSLGTTTIEFKPFGTIVDFLPIVLGNGNIRLEVRPVISQLDYSNSITIQGTQIPALNTRKVDTAVEMKAGQTFAIGGLIQESTATQKDGLPYISDVPILGVPFRHTSDKIVETELLIFVTPEFVDPIDACEVPCNGPGAYSTSPTNRGLYCGGQMEVPTACNPTQGLNSCGHNPCGTYGNCSTCGNGCPSCGPMSNMNANAPMPAMATPGMPMPGGAGYENSSEATAVYPTTVTDQDQKTTTVIEKSVVPPTPQDITLPATSGDDKSQKASEQSPVAPLPAPQQSSPPKAKDKPATTPPGPTPNGGASNYYYQPFNPAYATPRPYSPPRQPVFVRNASRPNNPQQQEWKPATQPRENNLIGPIGYDVQQ
jgi:pilus assembly protein CpaC